MIPALRPYQLRAIDDARVHIDTGKSAPLIVAPTGSGKTTIGADVVRSHVALGGKALWLAHRAELIDQARARLREFGVIADVTTVQALLSASKQRGAVLPKPTLMVLDEAHHYVADEWARVRELLAPGFIVGLTATPERGDGRGLGAMFDALVVAATIRELVELGHLCPLKVISPAKRLDPGELAMSPVEAYQVHGGETLPRAVVFAGSVEDARKIQDDFTASGISAGIIHGALTDWQRVRVLNDHASGKVPVIVGVHVLTEGWDSPATEICILARGCSTQGALLQMVGRVLRPAEGKKRALFIDLPGVVHVFGDPTEDKAYSLDGRGIRQKDGEAHFCAVCSALIPEEHEGPCPECGAAPGGNPRRATRIVNVPLGDYVAAKLGDLDKRAGQLATFMRMGFSRGYKAGWATSQFRREQGFWPTKKMIDLATNLVRGAA